MLQFPLTGEVMFMVALGDVFATVLGLLSIVVTVEALTILDTETGGVGGVGVVVVVGVPSVGALPLVVMPDWMAEVTRRRRRTVRGVRAFI